MSIAKVIEVISEGKSIEAAMQSSIDEASKTIKDIKQVNVDHIEGIVENNQITKFRVHAKISFVVHHEGNQR